MPDNSRDHARPGESRGPVDTAIDTVIDIDEDEFTIRPLASRCDYQACMALQNEVWGPAYGETVPASLLQVAQHVGGLAIGAFTAEGELVGFVFGLTGVKDGETVHWSHMLGVREAARNTGLGRVLKEYQRAELARLGIKEMHWTFDPLVAKNAHLNLNRLGAHVIEYVRDMYGKTGSPLHGSVTDRLVVSCPTDTNSRRVAAADAANGAVPILTPGPQHGDVPHDDASACPPTVWIEIPADIQRVIARSPTEAETWRWSVRRHFEWALGKGYAVTSLHRDPVTSRSFYTLELEAAAS
ncbi:MAG: hypothetical protein ACR2MQ_15660 [Gemmatimonadaceae bacterium]